MSFEFLKTNNRKQMKTNRWMRVITGTVTGGIDIWWIFEYCYLFYQYRWGGCLFLFMFPDWVLGLNVLMGSIGVLVSWKVMVGDLKIWQGLWIHLFLYALCLMVILLPG